MGRPAMYIEQLSLQDFRNYRHLNIAFPRGLLLFTGGNAQGKSNLLEAIYLLATTRSVRATSEGELVNQEWKVFLNTTRALEYDVSRAIRSHSGSMSGNDACMSAWSPRNWGMVATVASPSSPA